MVDIFLEIPDNVLRDYELRAALLRRDAESLMREAIERSAANLPPASAETMPGLEDEPIVKAAEIENESQRLGCELGWRFITCPQARMASSKLLLVGLNPGGRAKHGPSWSQEEGSTYWIESWNGRPPGEAPLQRQVKAMAALLGLTEQEVFSANFIPFRSADWRELDRKVEAEAFAAALWKWLIPQVRFDRVVCIGKDRPSRNIATLLDAKFEIALPTGWGTVTADRYRLPDGRPLVALPHLSRFGIFGRPQGAAALNTLFSH